MKKIFNWQVLLGLGLILSSFIVYYVHYLIFNDPHHIFIYLIGDIGFVFIEVLIVTLILHKLLIVHEKGAMLNKLNMVIGVFFTEVGVELLNSLSSFDDDRESTSQKLIISVDWPIKKFLSRKKYFKSHSHQIKAKVNELSNLKSFLKSKRGFLLNLLENPNLLEHDAFTNLLWAVFHLTDELVHRNSFDNLGDPDLRHLSGDIKRAYGLLIMEWLDYMRHLKKDYPYLFSIALRTNPFDKDASIEVK